MRFAFDVFFFESEFIFRDSDAYNGAQRRSRKLRTVGTVRDVDSSTSASSNVHVASTLLYACINICD
jgi:hypothetical protein